jgi:WD40 repeat protein
MTGLAFNPVNGVLYGVTGLESPNFLRNLVTINPATGAATVIGAVLDPQFGSSVGLTDLSFRSDGTLFAISPNEMYTVNLANAALTTIGSTGENPPGGGLAFSPSGMLFSAGSATGTVDTLNMSTGARTVGPTLTNSPHAGTLGAMNALAFNSAGTLFGSDSDRAQNGATTVAVDLVTINTATGVVTNVGAIPNDIDAIAFGPAVPEPSSVALLATGAGIFTYLRRRKSR